MLFVAIENEQEKVELNKVVEQLIERAVKETLLFEGLDFIDEVDVTLVDNESIKVLNREYRQIDKSTDVLSFPMYDCLDEIKCLEKTSFPVLIGDIVISLEQAKIQAEEFNHGIGREIAYLTVHSTLHLLGYDHMKKNDKTIMRQKEEAIMKIIGHAR